jgi:hypothetical protein
MWKPAITSRSMALVALVWALADQPVLPTGLVKVCGKLVCLIGFE